jgi:hypothetical protein
MEPNEHLERRNKEPAKWMADKCRTCEHARYYHLVDYSGNNDRKYIHAECNFLMEEGGFCSCLEWMPKDNLDYIELIAKRKGLIPDNEDEI